MLSLALLGLTIKKDELFFGLQPPICHRDYPLPQGKASGFPYCGEGSPGVGSPGLECWGALGSIPGGWVGGEKEGERERERTALHCQAMLRVPDQPLTIVAGPQEDLSAGWWPLPVAHHHKGHNPDGCRSSGLFVLSDHVTGARGQKKESCNPEAPPASQIPFHLPSLGNPASFLSKMKGTKAPQLRQHLC